jgi:FkbM family methyltransferase
MASLTAQPLPVPALTVPAHRRATLRLIRALPVGQLLALRTFRRLCRQGGNVQIGRTYFGAAMECELRDLIPSCIFHFGIWEPNISAFIQNHLKPGAVFCDIGANIGYHTLLASKVVGADGLVIAVEPSPVTVEKLRQNLERNQIRNVRIVQAACAAEAGTLTLFEGPRGNSGMATTVASVGGQAACQVPALPLTQILTPEERSRVSLIKIDVEGAEVPILARLLDEVDSFNRDLTLLVELGPNSDPAIFARYLAQGFRAYGLKNSYDVISGYLQCGSLSGPEPLYAAPREQQDVVFTRSVL